MEPAAIERIESAIREAGRAAAEGLGLELVELRLHPSGRRWHLRLDVDRPGPVGVGVDDCQRMSRALGDLLDTEDVVPCSYVLEVSSPGIDRPIANADDVRRNAGRRIIVDLTESAEGGPRPAVVRGVLLGSGEAGLRLRTDSGEERTVLWEEVARARREIAL